MDIALKVFFLSIACLMASIAGMQIKAIKKRKEKLRDMINKLNSAAGRVGARPEHTEVFNGISLGLDPVKGLLFYCSEQDRMTEVIEVSESIPAKVDTVMDSEHIIMISLSVTSINGLPYKITFFDWFLDAEPVKYDAEIKAYEWEEKVNKLILDKVSRKISPYAIY